MDCGADEAHQINQKRLIDQSYVDSIIGFLISKLAEFRLRSLRPDFRSCAQLK